jgi:cytochrome c oxidase subunit III
VIRAETARSLPMRGHPTGWWGMVMLITTEATLFSLFFFTYFFLRAQSPEWPPAGIEPPELGLIWLMTGLLLFSSAPMHLADRAIRKGRTGSLRVGLALTFALGASFLGLQGVEYASAIDEFVPQTNAYGSLFFTITGFHGLHVFVGLSMNLVIQVRSWRGHFDAERHLPVQLTAMYWHFVDAVWVVILFALYLSPHMGR